MDYVTNFLRDWLAIGSNKRILARWKTANPPSTEDIEKKGTQSALFNTQKPINLTSDLLPLFYHRAIRPLSHLKSVPCINLPSTSPNSVI